MVVGASIERVGDAQETANGLATPSVGWANTWIGSGCGAATANGTQSFPSNEAVLFAWLPHTFGSMYGRVIAFGTVVVAAGAVVVVEPSVDGDGSVVATPDTGVEVGSAFFVSEQATVVSATANPATVMRTHMLQA